MGARSRFTDADLLAAARRVFLRDGVDATAAAVAAEAGVSEALLFKRFGSKEALTQRAFAPLEPAWVQTLDAGGHPREVLEAVATEMIEHMRLEMPVTMMSWSQKPSEMWQQYSGDPPPVLGTKRLAAWFEREMRRGAMRQADPEVVARVFSGALVAFSMGEMTGLAERMPLASSTFVRGLVDALWRGLEPA